MFPLSVYIHWPFCKSKCPYCDFNSHVREKIDHARWRAALLRELESYAALLPDRRVQSIFFGGGTPSLMEPETVAALIAAVCGHWPVTDEVEITLEANPTSVEAGKLKAFREAGVNRVSLGVQSLLLPDLAFLGREHDVEEAWEAVRLARETFPRMSFDLIYARPGQTPEAWEEELTRALTLAKGHLSLYQLTIEENTAFHHAYKHGKFHLPEDGLAADLYALTDRITRAHKLPAYEISNYAAPGQESLHNLAYWRGDDYIGVGPGAHGRYRWQRDYLAGMARKSPERWLDEVERDGISRADETRVPSGARAEEMIMMGLRLTDGIDFAAWQARTGLDVRKALSPDGITRLREQGLIVADDRKIAATDRGRLLLNAVLEILLL